LIRRLFSLSFPRSSFGFKGGPSFRMPPFPIFLKLSHPLRRRFFDPFFLPSPPANVSFFLEMMGVRFYLPRREGSVASSRFLVDFLLTPLHNSSLCERKLSNSLFFSGLGGPFFRSYHAPFLLSHPPVSSLLPPKVFPPRSELVRAECPSTAFSADSLRDWSSVVIFFSFPNPCAWESATPSRLI